MSFIASCSRVSLIIFNVFFFMYAIGLFVIYLVMKLGNNLFGFDVPAIQTVTWITAAIILTASIYGCCVVQSENPKMIFLYAGFILACIVLQMAIPVIFYKQMDDITKQLFKNNVAKDFVKLDPPTQNIFQKIQQDNDCCGVNGATDYGFVMGNSSSIANVPDSCCHEWKAEEGSTPAHNQVGNCVDQDKLNKAKGCLKKILESSGVDLKMNVTVWIVAGVSYFFFQFIALILAIALGAKVHMDNKEKDHVRRNLMNQNLRQY